MERSAHLQLLHRLILSHSKMCFVSIQYLHIQSPHMWRVCDVTASINRVYVSLSFAYGHTTLNTPDLVWSRKLSRVGPGQYLDGRPPGNTRCCKLFALLFANLLRAPLLLQWIQSKRETRREQTGKCAAACQVSADVTKTRRQVSCNLWCHKGAQTGEAAAS